MEKLIVYSDKSSHKFSEGFSKNNFNEVMSRKKFLFLSKFLKFRDKIPYFLNDFHTFHEDDVRHIEAARKIRNVKKSDLSLVVFDAHTDMYQCGEKYHPIEEKVDMANWIAYMLNENYPDISILGVSDITSTCPQRKGFEYRLFKDRLSLFLGEDIIFEKDFKEYNNEFPLYNINDFFNKNLKKYSFISLDADVNLNFTVKTYGIGRHGRMEMEQIIKAIKYVKEKSNLIGFSFYASGWGEAFRSKSEILLSILNS